MDSLRTGLLQPGLYIVRKRSISNISIHNYLPDSVYSRKKSKTEMAICYDVPELHVPAMNYIHETIGSSTGQRTGRKLRVRIEMNATWFSEKKK